MRRALIPLLALAAAQPAWAAGSRCWVDRGVLVAPAVVAGIAGDYILDTGSAHTVIHETRAQGEALPLGGLTTDIRLAGLRLKDRPVTILDLDARTYDFPTPVAGVIGADSLAGLVLDVSYAPCRVALWRPGHAPRFQARETRRLAIQGGRPVLVAGVADGAGARLGGFVLATGSDRAIRLDPDPGKTVRALSVLGELWENAPAGPATDLPAGTLGEIGAPVLQHWRLRFDFAAGRLSIAGP